MGREGRNTLTLQIIHDEPYNSFQAFGTNAVEAARDITKGPSGSIESSIHNVYHGLIGRNGHMGPGLISIPKESIRDRFL